MNYMIMENDKMGLVYLEKMCAQLRPSWTLAYTAGDVASAVAWLDTYAGELQLIISDVELDDGNCFDIFDSVHVDVPVIFTTAYDEYVMKTFEQDNIDYLLKPIEPEALERAFCKFEKRQKVADSQFVASLMKVREQFLHARQFIDRILIPLGDKFMYLETSQIAYFSSEDKYVYAHIPSGKCYITSFRSLNDIESGLDPHVFFRVSRDIIASIHAVKKVSRFFKGRLSADICTEAGCKTVIISAERRNGFLDWLGK